MHYGLDFLASVKNKVRLIILSTFAIITSYRRRASFLLYCTDLEINKPFIYRMIDIGIYHYFRVDKLSHLCTLAHFYSC